MDEVKIAICDDDQMALETFTKLCEKIGEKHNVKAEILTYDNGDDLLFDIVDPLYYNTLDILLLDINMPGINGVEVAKKARDSGFAGIIIFVTASEDHFREAFDIGAFHYITKGESVKRFEEIFLKALETSRDSDRKEIVLSGWGEIKRLKISSIEYFDIQNRATTVYYHGGHFKFSTPLSKIEEHLKDYGFRRTHREYIVSLLNIKSISYDSLTMLDGKILPVGRKYYNEIKEALSKITVR